ncbi:hypothetical protein [Micromonospora aurantiaca (nom. illeg.)]|uniref:hypothetical protein n=1 Tax=Micromonospora aurantiaca (nom. illeg.) TaxID=47850 RepID=UPI0033CA9FA7
MMVDDAVSHLTVVAAAEAQLRGLLDEILAARRALDRPRLDRLDQWLHGPAAQAALDAVDQLAALDPAVLVAAATRTRVIGIR